MQLIRHTIEYIKTQKSFGAMLDNSRETIAEVTRVTPTYKLANRAKIIRLNQTKPNLFVMPIFESTESCKSFA